MGRRHTTSVGSGDPLGLTHEEAPEELRTATVTFGTESSRKPLTLNLLPSATSIKDLRELEDSVVWILRGAGSLALLGISRSSCLALMALSWQIRSSIVFTLRRRSTRRIRFRPR